MKKKVFAEVGFGNDSFFSTEVEEDKKEYRVPKFLMPRKIKGFYIRIWIIRRVLVLSTCGSISLTKKSKTRIKFLFGVEGVGL